METKMVDVLIHIDPETNHEQREFLRDLLLEHDGVDAAAYHDEKPHLMMIEYDPDEVTSKQLLDVVTKQNVHAELVGL
ncbi:MAG: ATP-binding protein [Gammaproteobacteria bacterium]|nr:ATP-binding protein [Gammaproteobacteria bacterium]